MVKARNSMIDVSVTVPAFNEGTRLPPYVERLVDVALAREAPVVEFLVSDDGSDEASAAKEREAVERAQRRFEEAGAPHRFRFRRAEKNRGKGAAIRQGWAEAAADARWLAFVDADGAISAEEFFRVASMLDDLRADVVAGSRIRMAGRHIERSVFRHLQGRVFATMVEWTFNFGFYDTQCGLKFFRGDLLRSVLPRLAEEHWMLDIEVLAQFQRQGARAVEVPIDWVDFAGSRVRFGVDAARMFVGLRRIQKRVLGG